MNTLKAQVTFWRLLPLLVTGHEALLKMVMLRYLLYYFANTPLFLPRKFFRGLDAILGELIWHAGCCMVALAQLRLLVDLKGLGDPNFEHYYLVAQLQCVSRWLSVRSLEETSTSDKLLQNIDI